MKKLISVLLTIAMMAMMMTTTVFAGEAADGATSTSASGMFNPDPNKIDAQAGSLADTALGIVQWVGYAFALGMLLYIGIKYMMSSANEKADLKKGLINYVIGAAILFGASTIVGMFENLL